MKKTFNLFLSILIILIGLNIATAQTLELTIANQVVTATTIKFDIYMRATVGTVYFAGGDMVLTFNSGNFAAPTNTKGANATFVLENTNVDNTTQAGGSVGAAYRGLTATAAITGNELIINVNTPVVADQATFNSDIAVIDATVGLHKFGTYTVTGISIPTGTFGLVWKTAGGVFTDLYTMANVTPWGTTALTLSTPAITDVVLPVELTSFTASANRLDAKLNWSTATEKNNYGFEIERRSVETADAAWAKVGFVQGAGTSNSPHQYGFIDKGASAGRYAYRLKQVDNDGVFKYSQSTEIEIGLAAKELTLSGNYPNPFNPTTNIEFTVATNGRAVLKVYNSIGQEVAELFNGEAQAGKIIQARFDASRLASGIYYSRLQADGKSLVKRMMFIK